MILTTRPMSSYDVTYRSATLSVVDTADDYEYKSGDDGNDGNGDPDRMSVTPDGVNVNRWGEGKRERVELDVESTNGKGMGHQRRRRKRKREKRDDDDDGRKKKRSV